MRSRSQVEAVVLALSRGLQPLEPYPGNNKMPWKIQHVKCGTTIVTSLNVIDQRHLGGCRACALAERGAVQVQKNADSAVKEMRAVGLEPLVPYPGILKPWLSKHETCGEEVSPRLANIRHTGSNGCVHCANNCSDDCGCSVRQAAGPSPAALWAKKKLVPLVDFPGNTKPWASRCEVCNNETAPAYANVRNLQRKNPDNSACKHCTLKCSRDCQCSVRMGRAA